MINIQIYMEIRYGYIQKKIDAGSWVNYTLQMYTYS